MKDEIPLQSFHSAGVMNRPQVWKVIALTLFFCGWQLSGDLVALFAYFGLLVLVKVQKEGPWGFLGFETMQTVHSFVVKSPTASSDSHAAR